MDIQQSTQNDVTILRLLGRLDELATSKAERAFDSLTVDSRPKVVLDLGGVEYVSSSGLRVLLMLRRSIDKLKGDLKLCNLTPFVAEVFEISNLQNIFAVYDTEYEALQAFGGGSRN
jgi:anti-sigma B factor antagonist